VENERMRGGWKKRENEKKRGRRRRI